MIFSRLQAGTIFVQPVLLSFRKNRYTGGKWQKAPCI
jgi:hypothetical protein